MNNQVLKSFLSSRNIHCDEKQIEQLNAFMDMTLETNEKFNLTAIKDKETFLEKMILDSALGLYNLDLKDKKVIDVGTGAGFPGVVLKILEPQANITLLDSTKKKIDYLQKYSDDNALGLSTICSRAEEYSRNNREIYDFAFARAVAALPILLELIVPLLKINGTFVAMKGPGAEEEIKLSENAMKKLGCVLDNVYIDELPESKEKRTLIYIKKIKQTNKKYPRDYSDIKKASL